MSSASGRVRRRAKCRVRRSQRRGADLEFRRGLVVLVGQEVAHDQLVDQHVIDLAGEQLVEAVLVVARVDEEDPDGLFDLFAVGVAPDRRDPLPGEIGHSCGRDVAALAADEHEAVLEVWLREHEVLLAFLGAPHGGGAVKGPAPNPGFNFLPVDDQRCRIDAGTFEGGIHQFERDSRSPGLAGEGRPYIGGEVQLARIGRHRECRQHHQPHCDAKSESAHWGGSITVGCFRSRGVHGSIPPSFGRR